MTLKNVLWDKLNGALIFPKHLRNMVTSCEVFAAKLLNLIKHEYREPCLKRCCDVINDVINMKDNVLYYIWVKESESEIRSKISWKLTKIEIQNLHFRFFTSGDLLNRKWYRKLMMSWRCALPSTTFWSFKFYCSLKIDGVIAISDFDLFHDLVTLTFDLWPKKEIAIGTFPRCICIWNLVMIG